MHYSDAFVTKPQAPAGKTSQGPATPNDSAVPNHQLEQQIVNDVLIDSKYEVWRSGSARRKTSYVPGNESPPPSPNPYVDCPPEHAKRLEFFSNRPCYVSGLGQRVDDSLPLVGLTFLEGFEPDDNTLTPEEQLQRLREGQVPGDQWKTLWVTHDQIADSKKCLDLSKALFPVRSSSSGKISDFLTDCFDANMHLPKQHIVRRQGHHEVDGKHGWLLGKKWIGPQVHVRPDPYPQDSWTSYAHPVGDAKAWFDFVRQQWERNWFVRWRLATAFVAPLLRFVQERTFAVHHYGQAKGAKSTIAFLAMTIFGAYTQLKKSFNRVNTGTASELFQYISDLPILLDETQGRTANLSNFIMQVCQEEHKTRGAASGGIIAMTSQPYRSAVLTTGEETLAGSEQEDLGGQARRALETRHPGLEGDHGIQVWRWLERKETYGHAGPVFLAKLSQVVNDPVKLVALQKRFAQFCDELAGVSGSLGDCERQLAAIALAEYLALYWLWDYTKEDAIKLALADAVNIRQNWLRISRGAVSLFQKGREVLAQHRHAFPQAYADISTPEGLNKIKSYGSKSSQAIVACINAGRDGNEIWYIPDSINKVLRERFGSPPDRFWEECCDNQILHRSTNSDRIVKSRQIKGVLKSTPFYVLDQDKIFVDSDEAPVVEESYPFDIEADADWFLHDA